jgi:ATP-dependent helicase/nuclease subunit A
MEHTGKLTVDEYHTLVPTSVNRLAGFLSSPLAERIRKADSEKQFYREKQFMILINAGDIDSEKYGNSEERIPVQGVIDAMFIEDGEIVILDYKTDRLSAGEEDKLVKLYKRQLDVYAEAAERLLGLPVKEKLLYSFSLGKEIKVE